MSKTIKAILIDSENKEVREIELTYQNGSYNQDMYKALKCEYITSACGEVFNNISHALFVDDEGLLKDEPIGAFCISMHPNPYISQTFSGNGIIVAIDNEGESCSHFIDIDGFSESVIWQSVDNLPQPGFQFVTF